MHTNITLNVTGYMHTCVMIMFNIHVVTYKIPIIKNSNFSHARCIDTVWGHVVVIAHKSTCQMLAS